MPERQPGGAELLGDAAAGAQQLRRRVARRCTSAAGGPPAIGQERGHEQPLGQPRAQDRVRLREHLGRGGRSRTCAPRRRSAPSRRSPRPRGRSPLTSPTSSAEAAARQRPDPEHVAAAGLAAGGLVDEADLVVVELGRGAGGRSPRSSRARRAARGRSRARWRTRRPPPARAPPAGRRLRARSPPARRSPTTRRTGARRAPRAPARRSPASTGSAPPATRPDGSVRANAASGLGQRAVPARRRGDHLGEGPACADS